MDGLSVVSVNGSRHAIMFVGDLGTGELTQLSEAVSVPLVRRLESVTLNPVGWSGSPTALLLARR
jgi:hypothetical protein